MIYICDCILLNVMYLLFILVYFFISLAVFEENVKVLSQPWRHRRRLRCAKALTFFNISVITEDIYLKLRVVVHFQKGNPYQ